MVVTCEASQTQVTGESQASVLFGEDVIDVEGKSVVLVGHLAVFATATRTLPDQFLKHPVHARSVRLAIAALLQGTTSFRLHDINEMPNAFIIVDGNLLIRR